MAANEFLIAAKATGSNPNNWTAVEGLLAAVSGDVTMRAFEFNFQPYAKYVKLGNAQKKGMGFPVATWSFRALRSEQRENLRDFCADISAEVYIRTRTNETVAGAAVWKDYLCIMNWVERAELIGVAWVEMIEITFTRCVAV